MSKFIEVINSIDNFENKCLRFDGDNAWVESINNSVSNEEIEFICHYDGSVN